MFNNHCQYLYVAVIFGNSDFRWRLVKEWGKNFYLQCVNLSAHFDPADIGWIEYWVCMGFMGIHLAITLNSSERFTVIVRIKFFPLFAVEALSTGLGVDMIHAAPATVIS